MERVLRFPHAFLWGAATAAYQVEGNIENTDWAKADREGKVPVCGLACNHYNLYETDFDIAQKIGHNAHKFSIEWARIEPYEGEFDNKEIEHYRNVIKALKRRGIEPMIGLWHFTLPLWFSDMGGFINPKSIYYFERYCAYVAKELFGEIKFALTINEPIVYAVNGYRRGIWPPFKNNHRELSKVIKNMAKAHKRAYVAIKNICPDVQISIQKNNIYFHTESNNPINKIKVMALRWWWNYRFLNLIENHMDFIGLNYYFHRQFGQSGPYEKYEKTDMDWDICPEGLYNVLKELNRYKKPVYVIENGIADRADSKREKFITEHVYQVYRAIETGIQVGGYLYWSLLDNYEWAKGFEMRFGLVDVDYVTEERKIRPSAFKFKEICESNTLKI